MLSFAGRVVIDDKQTKEKLKEWLDSLPETVRQKESANVLAFVFFVEVLKGKETEKEKVESNA